MLRRILHAGLIAQGDFVRLVKPQAQRAHAPAGQVQAALSASSGQAQARHPSALLTTAVRNGVCGLSSIR